MTEPNGNCGGDLTSKLKVWKESLRPCERDLLTGILIVAHGLTNGSNENGAANVRKSFEEAFDKLPPEKISMIMAYASEDNPGMIVKTGQLPVAKNGTSGDSDERKP